MAVREDPRPPSSSPDRPRPTRKPLDFALRRLSRRAHSEGELEAKMAGAGYLGEEIENTLSFLRERRYLDDPTFARDFARNRNEHRLWGPARIQARLKQLRLSDEDIDSALSEVFPEGEEEAAKRALDRFLRLARRPAPRNKRMARAYRHLLTRGFSPSVAHQLVSGADFADT